jgi:dephospho-CoA kinase
MSDARPIVIGLAGGIGAGKSLVARVFAELGCVVIDSDAEAKAALDRPEVRRRLVEWWGSGVVGADGKVDRAEVAKIVFTDEAARRRLEALVHPLVKAARDAAVARASAAGAPAVVVDAPLLFEAGVDKECDVVVFVDAPRAARLARVKATRGWDEPELDRRERAQWGLDVKRPLADYVVVNDRDPGELRGRVGAIFHRIIATRPGRRA